MYAEHGQDLFAIKMLAYCQRGNFLDIGCAHPIASNNTYLLEKNYEYTGICIDKDDWSKDFSIHRLNSIFINQDALTIDYKSLLPDRVDYLSIDIDPGEQSLEVLKLLPVSTRFNVITFEFETPNSYTKIESKRYLLELGYKLVIENVYYMYNNIKCPLEDWYVDADMLKNE